MRKFFLSAFILVLALQNAWAEKQEAGIPSSTATLDREEVVLPPYESVPELKDYATASEYEAARKDKRFQFTRMSYDSDGIKVFAYLYAPVDSRGRLPVVVFNRGSWTWKEFSTEYLTTFHRLAEGGFVVLAPMIRGSGGAPGRDELGGADLADLMNTAALLRRLPFVDAENVFMYGQSRGGMMTYQAMRDQYPMKAAAVYGAFTNLAELTQEGSRMRGVAIAIWPDYNENHSEIDRRRSALEWPERLNIPILIMHGGADPQIPPSQSLALAAKLQALGKPYELVIRAGEDHSLSQWREERDALAMEWFRRHLS